MWVFFDFSARDHIEVAHRLASLHRRLDGDYESVVMAVIAGICQRKPASSEFYDYFLRDHIRNYRDLVAAQLNALVAPPATPMSQTIADCSASVERHLRAQGIPEKFISGDNTGVMTLLRELRKMVWLIAGATTLH